MLTVTMAYEKSTKGAHRFSEIDSKGNKVDFAFAVIGTLYVRKTAMELAPPLLTVTIEGVNLVEGEES